MVQITRPWPNPHLTEAEFRLYRAKISMMNATKSIATKVLWKFGRGPEVLVKWPNGPMIQEHMDQYKTDEELLSADPNDHYRPWLEDNVGEQGWDWDWKIGSVAADNGVGTFGYDTVCIKLRKKHEHFASVMALKWA